MMLRRFVYADVVYPAYHALRRDGINRARAELDASQWYEREAFGQLQRRKLLELLRFAQQHVPYYAALFRTMNLDPEALVTGDRLLDLPVLEKDTIRREGGRMEATPGAGRTGFPNSTSGSTGEPLRFRTDTIAHAYRLADELRGQTLAGARLGDRHLALWGGPLEINRAQRFRGRLHGWVTGHWLLSTQDLSSGRLDAYVQTIQQIRPALLTAYPSALEVLAEHCLHRDLSLDSSVGAILCSAETLWPHQRRLFEEVFGANRVFNRYGSREVGAIAHECDVHGGLHVSADRLLVEIVDGQGNPCPPGVTGEVLVTDLESHAMPLIRYRIGDSATWSEGERCPCGRGLPLLESVEGRAMDVLRAPDGHAVGGTFFTMLLRSRGGIKRFRINQDSSGAVHIRFVAEQAPAAAVLADFTRQIRDRLGAELPITFERVAEIPSGDSGKQRLISSDYRSGNAATETSRGVY